MDYYRKCVNREKILLLFPVFIVCVAFYFWFIRNGGIDRSQPNWYMEIVMGMPMTILGILTPIFRVRSRMKMIAALGEESGTDLREELNSCKDVFGNTQFLFDDYLISFEDIVRIRYDEIECVSFYTRRNSKSHNLRYFADLLLSGGKVVTLRIFGTDPAKGHNRFRLTLLRKAPNIREVHAETRSNFSLFN